MNAEKVKRHRIVDFDALPPAQCPCGTARRALADVAEFPGTIHRTHSTLEGATIHA